MLKNNIRIIKSAEFTVIIIFAIVIMSGTVLFSYPIYGQGTNTSNTSTTNTNGSEPLPVLLIHGYMSDASVWKKWEDLLKKDNIPVFPITFTQSDDKCGSAAE